ncbi:MAG: hypothetical protein AAFV71_24670 [Cyanobacteria bacterium J06633_8]
MMNKSAIRIRVSLVASIKQKVQPRFEDQQFRRIQVPQRNPFSCRESIIISLCNQKETEFAATAARYQLVI